MSSSSHRVSVAATVNRPTRKAKNGERANAVSPAIFRPALSRKWPPAFPAAADTAEDI